MELLTVYAPANTGGADVLYVPVPCRCVINSIVGAASVDIGDEKEFAFYNGSTKQATFNLGTDVSVGDTGSATIDATTIFEAGTAIKIDIPQAAVAGEYIFVIRIDPFLAGVSGT